MGKAELSLYGSTAMVKAYCEYCESYAFVIDNRFQCCDIVANVNKIDTVRRESGTKRLGLTKSQKDIITRIQRCTCYLCGIDLSTIKWYIQNGRPKMLRKEFDHFVPRAFCDSNDLQNIYLMCNLCNRQKGSKMFESRGEAVGYVMDARRRKGLMDIYSDVEMEATQWEIRSGSVKPVIQNSEKKETGNGGVGENVESPGIKTLCEDSGPSLWTNCTKSPVDRNITTRVESSLSVTNGCVLCGKKFKTKIPWKKFCSNKCGNKVRMERYWAKRLAR